MSSWWWHTDLCQNFQPDLLKPEKVNGTESRVLTTLQWGLLGSPALPSFANYSHYPFNIVVHRTKSLVSLKDSKIQHYFPSDACYNQVLIKYNALGKEEIIFYIRGISGIKFIFKEGQSVGEVLCNERPKREVFCSGEDSKVRGISCAYM